MLTILVSLDPKEEAFARIQESCPGCEIRVGPWITMGKETMPEELMKGVDVLLCEYPPPNFEAFDQLKWIQLTSAGYTQVLDLPILERGIRVTNGLGNFDGPIAEWNIMMMLMWERNMLDLLENQKGAVWDRDARFQRDLFGATIGFYGYGGIARETARLAKAMHLNVRVMTRDGKIKPRDGIYCVEGTGDPQGVLPDQVFDPTRMEAFMSELDYFFVTLPLNPATEGIIGEKELRMLKPSAVIINPSRATLIPEEVFIRCLRENWVRGASLDVHYAYPLPPEHPLWSMPNLIITPHISGSGLSPYFLKRVYDTFAINCAHYVRDEPMTNELSETQIRGE